MSRRVGRHAQTSDARLLWTLVTASLLALLLVLALSARSCSSDNESIRDFSVVWSVKPIWNGSARPSAQKGEVSNKNHSLAIYLDVSQPIGGFLPPPARQQELSALRSLLYWVPDHLVRVSGSTASRVQWHGVSSDVVTIERPDRIDRQLFVGEETRLNLAIAAMIAGLKRREVEAAALVTDLIATEELTGAMGAAQALSDWLDSPEVRGGRFHLGLLGVRAPYWGVSSRNCPATGELGCWYSEQARQFRPLSESVKIPLYVLILGSSQQAVEEMGQGLLSDARSLGFEVRWELLTRASETKKLGPTSCHAHEPGRPEQRQSALFRTREGLSRCLQGDEVELICQLPGLDLTTSGVRSSWSSVTAEFKEGQLVALLDCDAMREERPARDLILEIEGIPRRESEDPWNEWSTETDELEQKIGRTLQLKYFLEKVRLLPDRLRITSEPLLRVATDGR